MVGCTIALVSMAVSAFRSRGLTMAAAVTLGVIEGLTEFLPVSSTGHLTVVARILGLDGPAVDSYVVVVQGGAIVAVVALYRRRLAAMLRGIGGDDVAGRRLLVAVAAAFVPAAAVGLLFGGVIEKRLFGVGPVAAAWAVGGVVILVVARRLPAAGAELELLQWRAAVTIGAAQTLALWPGVSRSLVTIVGGVAVGLSVPAAVEFSFLLGLVTLGAATIYELITDGDEIIVALGVVAPAAGFVVAFAAALGSIRWMVGYLEQRSLAVFGVYRLVAATVAVALLAVGAV